MTGRGDAPGTASGVPAPLAAGAAPVPAERPPAVVVHDAAGAEAALRLAGPRGVVLLSARGAAGSLGAAWFLALTGRAAARVPGVRHLVAMDCADAPGQALAALRAGARLLILDPAVPAFPAIAAAAAEAGATLWPVRPPALDLRSVDPGRAAGRARLEAWLRGTPPDDETRPRGAGGAE